VIHGPVAHLIALLAAGAAIFGCAETKVVIPPPEAPPPVITTTMLPPPPSRDPVTVKLDGGCEDALAAYVKECMDNAKACRESKGTGDVTVNYATVLNGGAYLDTCKSPASSTVKICAAIRNGRAVAVTVTSTPGDEHTASCIGRAVQGLSFTTSPRLDVASTTFAAQ
jgi:hypothetical protein